MQNLSDNAQTDLDELLDRYVNHETTAAETKKIETWLEVKKSDHSGALHLTKQEEKALFQKIIDPSVSPDEIRKFRPSRVRRFLQSPLVRIAAGFVIVAVAVWVMQPAWLHPGMHVTTAKGQTEKIILPDQSIVWLHKDSKLTWYSSGDHIRHVQLEGAGLFEVAKDAAHPFTVSYNTITATVLGTSFSLKTTTENIELSVLTGKVKLSSVTDTQGIEVLPNEKVVYNGSGMQSPKAIFTEEQAVALTSGTEYNMNFLNTPMKEVFARMEKKFDIKITVTNEAIERCHLKADFTDRSLENTLMLLREIINVEYTINDKSISISGNGCP